MGALRRLADSAQCVGATLRASRPSSQEWTEISPCREIVWALVVLPRPNVFDSGEHSQTTDAGAHRLGYERPRQAYLTMPRFTKVSLRDEAPFSDERFDTPRNCSKQIVVTDHVGPLSTGNVRDDPRDL